MFGHSFAAGAWDERWSTELSRTRERLVIAECVLTRYRGRWIKPSQCIVLSGSKTLSATTIIRMTPQSLWNWISFQYHLRQRVGRRKRDSTHPLTQVVLTCLQALLA